jgi:hypothetical protein
LVALLCSGCATSKAVVCARTVIDDVEYEARWEITNFKGALK